jgi:pilus assembly protein FimV
MALFGFNKQKVLASAEKYVQQGKLQNAISEYEKVLKNDTKDLTVTNTVGDLYSRLGETSKATECFKTVGDAYASQGFTVKAIAMYKKICKLQPSLESLLKLAELYSQQGLFNDARAQYLQVAEEFLKNSEFENAIRIFQKIVEMDPENSGIRVRLAEVYLRLNKKTEAWQIFSAAAESLRAKGSLSGAEEILQRMLKLDPGNTYALLMQGKNMMESGDAAAAVATLQKVSDIDSHPDGLRDLLKAYLQAGQLSEAGTIANKLLTVHNDLHAISSFADALMQAGQYETALQVFDEHAERLLAENSDKVLESLHTIIGHVRDNPDSLQKLLDLFHKAGENTHVSEVYELLAHASVQSGDLPRARDLYQKLATVEPQNPLHMQNYQQVVGQLGGTSGSKLITPDEAVVLIDDLEATAPSIHQHYTDEIALAVRSALTDAELFISYNMPAKALGPLVGALPLAPTDLRVNQRLAALHTRAGRFAEAALCCRTLQNVYSESDHPEEATRYGELADRYEERSSVSIPVASPEDEHIFLDAPAPAQPKPGQTKPVQAKQAQAKRTPSHPVQEPESDVPEFAVEEVPGEDVAAEEEAAPVAQAAWPTAAEPEFAVVDESSTASEEPAAASGEIDLSSEWDDSLTVEADAPAAEVEASGDQEAPDTSKADETVEEIRFYLGHGMPAQAMAALAKLQTLTSDAAMISELRAEVEAATQAAAEQDSPAATEPEIEELTSDDIPTVEVTVDETPVEEAAAAEEPVTVEPEPAVEEVPVVAEAAVESVPEPVVHVPVVNVPSPVIHAPVVHTPAAHAPVVHAPVVHAPVVHAPVVYAPPAAPTTPAVAATPAPVLGEFVADIEASLGEDFLKSAPVVQSAPVPVPAPLAPRAIPPMAASAAASASPANHVAPSAPATTASVAWHAPVADVPRPQPPAVPAATSKASPFGESAGVDLAEMFGELKKDLDADIASADEDPETHYNLGIAFREMGLLDEAIGELQKACQSFEQGHPFPQIMQTYTWLAQCFLEKGVPEAAIRWYDKALNVPTIDGETRVALHYELASAYETAGDKPSALKHFMNVYGTNIDYRDVAERIKAVKS